VRLYELPNQRQSGYPAQQPRWFSGDGT